MTYHAHVESAATDCDGTYTSGYTMVADAGEESFEFDMRVLSAVVSTGVDLGCTGRLEVNSFEDHTNRYTWTEATEEGGRERIATTCWDDCADAAGWQRDHTAEAMGY